MISASHSADGRTKRKNKINLSKRLYSHNKTPSTQDLLPELTTISANLNRMLLYTKLCYNNTIELILWPEDTWLSKIRELTGTGAATPAHPDEATLSVPEQYSLLVPFESSPVCACSWRFGASRKNTRLARRARTCPWRDPARSQPLGQCYTGGTRLHHLQPSNLRLPGH